MKIAEKIYDYIIDEFPKWGIGALMVSIVFTFNKSISTYDKLQDALEIQKEQDEDFRKTFPAYYEIQQICDSIESRATKRYEKLKNDFNLFELSKETPQEVIDALILRNSSGRLICSGEISKIENLTVFEPDPYSLNLKIEMTKAQLEAEIKVWESSTRALEALNEKENFELSKIKLLNEYEKALIDLYQSMSNRESASDAILKNLIKVKSDMVENAKYDSFNKIVKRLIFYSCFLVVLLIGFGVLLFKGYKKFEKKED